MAAVRVFTSREPHCAVLALLQALFAVESIAYSLLPGESADGSGRDAFVALGFAVLAATSVFALPRLSGAVLDGCLAATWLALAVTTAMRTTREGQLVVIVSVLLLAVYTSYSRPRRTALAHLVGMSVAFLTAVLIHDARSAAAFVGWAVVSVVVTAWVVLSLRERDRHLRLILEHSADVVFHTKDGVFRWVSPAAVEVLGWQPADLVGVRKLDFWHPDDREAAQALRERTKHGQTARETMRFRRADGRYAWIEATMRPYVDAYGEPGISGSMRDVSDRVEGRLALTRSEQEQRELAARLADALQIRSRLVQNISHEFRTPLTVMRGTLQRTARRGESLTDEDRDEIEAALRASRRLGRLIDELLVVAQSDSGALMTVREAVDVPTLTAEAGELFRPICENAGIQLSVSTGDVPVPLWLDGEAWARIVTNLVSNAVRFTPDGSIDIRLAYDEPWLSLEVVDSGPGIDPADRAVVFERFRQGRNRPVRGGEGTGIGLATVGELARDLDGDCGLDAGLGHRGTRAWVRLPASRSEPTGQFAVPPSRRRRRGHDGRFH
jgi:PAS domain S-box-containing protein